MARYCKFFQGLRKSPCREVAILANLIARDRRSVTGKNVRLVMENSGAVVRSGSPAKIRAGLVEAELVEVAAVDKWRVNYLDTLLQPRQEWHYRGEKEEEEQIQTLIVSLCVN
jgi:hypothetical protein